MHENLIIKHLFNLRNKGNAAGSEVGKHNPGKAKSD